MNYVIQSLGVAVFGGLLFVVPLLLLVGGGVVVLVVLAVTQRPDATLTAEVASARRHGLVTSGVATGVQLAAPFLLAPVLLGLAAQADLPPGPVVGVLPLAGTVLGLGVLLVGELTWPRPRGATRTAVLADRAVRDLGTGWRAWSAVAACLLLVATLVVGAVLADASGRGISVERPGAGGLPTSQTAGPFPGLAYGGAQLVALLLVAVLVLLVLRAATHRATVVTADLDTDRLLRRASAARSFRLATVGVLVTLAADLLFGGNAARNVTEGPGQVVTLLVVMLGLTCAVGALVALLVPAPRLGSVAATVPSPARA